MSLELPRRGFLFGLAAAMAAPAIVRASALMPVKPWARILYGDGVHDDADAINALTWGEPVVFPGGALINVAPGLPMIPPGTYRISAPIKIPVNFEKFIIRDCHFEADPNVDGYLDFTHKGEVSGKVYVESCAFTGGTGRNFFVGEASLASPKNETAARLAS